MKTIRSLVLAVFVVAIGGGLSVQAQDPIDLDQNWSPSDREAWYGATQGSRLLPLSWFEALEQPGLTRPFLADDYISSFRYLPRSGSLPVGFAIDSTDDTGLSITRLRWTDAQTTTEPWVGFNCSACHTAELTFKGARVRVEGGPTLADFQGFMEALDQALTETRDDPARFTRFASRILAGHNTTANQRALKDALGRLVAWQLDVARMNATDLRYGFGRLDAFGHIYNKVALVVGAEKPTPNAADAPVSYPFLWNVPQEDWVQWNAMAPNKVLPSLPSGQSFDIGALGRNVGEVIGVFADVKPTAAGGLSGYPSSLHVENLVSMEQMLGRLRPPAWPSVFGVPDPASVAKGKQLFDARCSSCHVPLERSDLTTAIKVKSALLRDDAVNRTDPWMACNAYVYQSQTGVLAGTPRDYFKGGPLGATAPLADMLSVAVEGSLAGKKGAILQSAALSFFGRQPPPVVIEPPPWIVFNQPLPRSALSPRDQRLAKCLTEASRILGYKARPLTGIWATAPYLHNGSIPTLYDLLLPPEKRPDFFWVGTREFDPDKVGFVTVQGPQNSFLLRTRDISGRMIDGNSNAGHDYGNSELDDAARKALVDYMKTL